MGDMVVHQLGERSSMMPVIAPDFQDLDYPVIDLVQTGWTPGRRTYLRVETIRLLLVAHFQTGICRRPARNPPDNGLWNRFLAEISAYTHLFGDVLRK